MGIVRPLPVRSGFFVMTTADLKRDAERIPPKMREVRQFDSKLHMNGENAENFFEMERWFDKHFRHAFL